jgi:pimeloyl-ACP methyl ester carboxylesterase
VGHSAGGGAVMALAAADRRVDTFVAMAPASPDRLPRTPGLVLAGDADQIIVLSKIKSAYAALRGPKQLVVLADAGHHAFSDLCEVGAGQGGLLEVADMLGFPVSADMARLATDGCEAPDLPPTKSWPAVRQATVAQLRYAFGFDRSRAGLAGLPAAYRGIVASSKTSR